jgi:hypothetical protein
VFTKDFALAPIILFIFVAQLENMFMLLLSYECVHR